MGDDAAVELDDTAPLAPTVELRSVSKCYSRELRDARRNGLAALRTELVAGRGADRRQLRTGEFWAVREVSLAVAPGEALGIVGVNGAGKSTLLRLIAGITRPSEGEVVAPRSIAALLDPMAGFDPVLTGRENAEVSFTLVAGRPPSPEEVDELLGYAQLTAAADHPVRTYSQGMRVRLAFSVMVFVDPDVMVIDEALAVGDTAFQLQCLDRLHAHCRAGGSLVFASHSMWAFQHVATRGIHLHEGRVAFEGAPEEVADRYLALIRSQSHDDVGDGPDLFQRERVRQRSAPGGDDDAGAGSADGEPEPDGGRPVRFASVVVRAADGPEPTEGHPLEVELSLVSREAFDAVTLGFMVWTADLTVCILADLSQESAGDRGTFSLPVGATTIRATVDPMPLLAGPHAIRAAVYDGPTGDILGMTGFEDAPWWFDVAPAPAAPPGVHLGGALRPLRVIEAQIQK